MVRGHPCPQLPYRSHAPKGTRLPSGGARLPRSSSRRGNREKAFARPKSCSSGTPKWSAGIPARSSLVVSPPPAPLPHRRGKPEKAFTRPGSFPSVGHPGSAGALAGFPSRAMWSAFMVNALPWLCGLSSGPSLWREWGWRGCGLGTCGQGCPRTEHASRTQKMPPGPKCHAEFATGRGGRQRHWGKWSCVGE